MWAGVRIWEDCRARVSVWCDLTVINQSIYWVLVTGMLLWIELFVLMVGLDV
jgi:hypothetical protein